MASLSKRGSTGSYAIQFVDRDRRTRTITLGKIPQRSAQQILVHVEQLVAAQFASTAPKAETSRWLAAIDERLTEKLARVGLIETRHSATLGAFIDSFLASREADPRYKPRTVLSYEAPFKGLRKHFGDSQPLRTITKGDAQAWRTAITEGKAENTIRKWITKARTLFNAAIESELIDRNPFAGMAANSVRVQEKDHFITKEDATKVLAACPSLEWRLIFALARYGGLRCPSETLALRWDDILWDQDRFIVHSSKTARHEGCGSRIVPLFPELEPLLSEAFTEAADGTEYVIDRTLRNSANLRTTMTKIIKRAGLEPWPKLFQNMRSSRATELVDIFPEHVATSWLGHSVKVAQDHYWRVNDSHFDMAVGKSAVNCAVDGAGKGVQSDATKNANSINAVVCTTLHLLSTCTVAREGLEPPTKEL